MINIPVPVEKLMTLREAAGLTDEVIGWIEPCREALLAKQDEFPVRFREVFIAMPATRVFLEHEEVPGHIEKLWKHWYVTVFGSRSVQELMGYLWRVGLRHVEVNLEQSYTIAGFAIVRRFVHDILEREFSPEQACRPGRALDSVLDLCLMVETQAYIENLSRCDMDIMGGIADKVRNPATVIGGNIRRLMKKGIEDPELHEVYRTIIEENARLERMVSNIKKYIEIFRRESEVGGVSLQIALERAMERLAQGDGGAAVIDMKITPEAALVTGSPSEIEEMFYYLLMNCMEDPGFSGETIHVRVEHEPLPSRNVRIAVFCPGSTLAAEDAGKVFHPFYSQGSGGTGFGLPTALLVVRKNHGRFHIETSEGGDGTWLVITLPSAD